MLQLHEMKWAKCIGMSLILSLVSSQQCLSEVRIIGCAATHSLADHHFDFLPITMSVVTQSLNQSVYCMMRRKSYMWSMSNKIISHGKRTVTVIPAQYNVSGSTDVHVMMNYSNDFGLNHVEAKCYIKLSGREFKVSIWGVDRVLGCERIVDVMLKAVVDTYAQSQMEYRWTCPKDLCQEIPRNKDILAFQANVDCNASFPVELRVTHIGFNRSSAAIGTVKSHPNPYSLFFSCQPNCHRVNAAFPLTIIATEEPNVNNEFKWLWKSPNSAFEELVEARDNVSESRILIVKPHALESGKEYEFQASTSVGSNIVRVTTVPPMTEIECNFTRDGQAYFDLFDISCSGGSSWTYSVVEGANDALIAFSSIPIFKVYLTFDRVAVVATDGSGQTSELKLGITLTKSSKENFDQALANLPSQIENLGVTLNSRDFLKVAHEVDRITKLIQQVDVPFTSKYRLVSVLSQIKSCPWIECVVKIGQSVERLSFKSIKWEEGEQADDYIFKIGAILHRLSLDLHLLLSKAEQPSSFVLSFVLQTVHIAITFALGLADPFLVDKTLLSKPVRWRRYRKVVEGNNLMRKAVQEMALAVVQNIPYPTSPFIVEGEFSHRIWIHFDKISNALGRRDETLRVIANHPFFINEWTESFGKYGKSYVEILPKMIRKLLRTGHQTAIAVVNYRKESFWWSKSNAKSGEMLEIHVLEHDFHKWSAMSEAIGPLECHFFVKEPAATAISGTIVAPNSFSEDEKENDMYVDVHKVVVPRGHGSLLVRIPSNLSGELHVYVNTSFWPSFFIVENESFAPALPPILYRYYTPTTDNVYVGILPKSLTRRNYSLYLSLIQCVTWSDGTWDSDDCLSVTYEKSGKALCSCNHSSLLNARVTAVESTLIKAQNMGLYTTTTAHVYVLIIVVAVALVLEFMVTYASNTDAADKTRRNAMFLEDNYPGDAMPYLIAIYTGNLFMASTSSNVAIRLVGLESMSRVHILDSSKYKCFNQGTDCWFILYTKQSLGSLVKVELWLDKKSCNSDWYCHQIIIYDFKTTTKYYFPVDTWLIPSQKYVVGREEFRKWKPWTEHIKSHFLAHFQEWHHWASVFVHHPRSVYTVMERTSILTLFITVTMYTSISYYTADLVLDRYHFRYTWDDLVVSTVAMTVAYSITLLVSCLYRPGKHLMLKRLGKYSTPPTFYSETERFLGNFIHPVYYVPIMSQRVLEDRIQRSNPLMYPAYLVSSVIIGLSFFFTLKIGWGLSKNQALIWLVVVFVALLADALLLNPAFIMVMAVLVAYVYRSSAYDFDEIFVASRENVMPYMYIDERLDQALVNRLESSYKPPLSGQRKKRDRNELYIFLVTLIALVLVFVLHLSHMPIYRAPQLLENLTPTFLNRSQYFDYLHSHVLTSLHKVTWYDGTPLPYESNENNVSTESTVRGYCSDYVTKLVGVPRLRLKRISPQLSVPVAQEFRNLSLKAYGHLSFENEDKDLYSAKWVKPVPGKILHRGYRYWSEFETKTGPLFIVLKLFRGDGYVQNLHYTMAKSGVSLVDLQFDNYIDNLTRVVFLTFNLYNANVRELSSVTVITEVLPSGVLMSQLNFDSNITDLSPYVIITVIVLISIALVFHGVWTVIIFSRKRWSTVEGVANLAVIVIGVAIVLSLIIHMLYFVSALEDLSHAPKDGHTSLYYFFVTGHIHNLLIGLFAICVTMLESIMILRYSVIFPRTVIGATVTIASYTLLYTLYFYRGRNTFVYLLRLAPGRQMDHYDVAFYIVVFMVLSHLNTALFVFHHGVPQKKQVDLVDEVHIGPVDVLVKPVKTKKTVIINLPDENEGKSKTPSSELEFPELGSRRSSAIGRIRGKLRETEEGAPRRTSSTTSPPQTETEARRDSNKLSKSEEDS